MEVECSSCQASFSSKEELKTHLRTKKSCAKYICNCCGGVFFSKYNVERHQTTCRKFPQKILKNKLSIASRENDRLSDENEQLKSINDRLIEGNKNLRMELQKCRAALDAYESVHKPRHKKENKSLAKVITDPDFCCTTDGVLNKLNSGEYVFKDGKKSLARFLQSLITDSNARCYVRTDPSRPNFYKWTGAVWLSDPNAQFFRDVFDLMRDHSIEKMKEHIDQDLKFVDRSDGEANMLYREKYLKPIHEGIIYPDSQEREILIREAIKRTSHVTKID
jgi:hypothetical protein